MSSREEEDETNATRKFTHPGEPSDPTRHVLRVLNGVHGGRTLTLETGESVVGRSQICTLPFSDPGLSRRHASFVVSPDGVHLTDLGSRNGTSVNGKLLSGDARLQAGDLVVLGGVRLYYTLECEQLPDRDWYEAAVRDAVTGLYNRRFFEERLPAEVAFAARHTAALSLLLVEVDSVSQQHEVRRQVSEEALKLVATALAQGVRTEDLVARREAYHFAVIARGAELEGALALAERLRQRVEATPLQVEAGELRVTISAGVAAVSSHVCSTDRLLRAAQFALGEAVSQGRNRVAGSTGASDH